MLGAERWAESRALAMVCKLRGGVERPGLFCLGRFHAVTSVTAWLADGKGEVGNEGGAAKLERAVEEKAAVCCFGWEKASVTIARRMCLEMSWISRWRGTSALRQLVVWSSSGGRQTAIEVERPGQRKTKNFL